MNSSVVSLNEFRTKKQLSGDRKAGVAEIFGKAIQSQGSLHADADATDTDLVARIERIKSSISRINELMAELKAETKPKI